MKAILLISLALVSVFNSSKAAQGDEVFRGFLVAKDDSVCFGDNDADNIVDTAGVSIDPDTLSPSCTLMSFKEGSAEGVYTLQSHESPGDYFYIYGGDAYFYEDPTSIILTQEDDSTQITGITSSDVTALIDQTNAFHIREAGINDVNCVKHDGTHSSEGCENALWYFVPACSGNKCVCDPEPAICKKCGDDQAVNTAGDDCVDCDGVTSCLTCDVDGSDNVVCLTCGSSKYPATGGASCDDCATIIPDCATCSVEDGVTKCDSCSTKELSADKSGCFSCDGIADCESCIGENKCGACSGGKVPNTDGSLCEATTTTEATTETTATAATTASSDGVANSLSVLAIVGMALVMMA